MYTIDTFRLFPHPCLAPYEAGTYLAKLQNNYIYQY